MQRTCVLCGFLWRVLLRGLAWTLLIYGTARARRVVFLRAFEEGDFDHAVDNFGDSAGLVADWVARSHWRRPHPPVAGSGGGCPDNQPRDWTSGSLIRSHKEAQEGQKVIRVLCFYVLLCG